MNFKFVGVHIRAILMVLLIINTTLFGAPVAPAGSTNVTTMSSSPNIIHLLMDDGEYDLFMRLLQGGYLPNLQKYVIDGGVTFNNYYITDARGCPSRTTSLNGRYPHNNQDYKPNQNGSCGVSIFDDSNTLPLWLQKVGYDTSLNGRFVDGLGYTDANKDGVINNADLVYRSPGWTNWQAFVFPPQAGYTVAPGGACVWWENANQNSLTTYNPAWPFWQNNNGTIVQPTGDQADWLTTQVIGWLTSRTSQNPFYEFLTPTIPHIESVKNGALIANYQASWNSWRISPAARYVGRAAGIQLPMPPNFNIVDSGKPDWVKALLALTSSDIAGLRLQDESKLEAVMSVDDMIGQLAQQLQSTGQLQNTIWIVTTDNGFFKGNHRLTSKLAPYEEAVHVPLWIMWPGVTDKLDVHTSDALVLNTDIAPTIAAIAGARTDGMEDGTSIVPLLYNPTLTWRNYALLESWQVSGVQNPDNAGPFAVPTVAAVRTSGQHPTMPNQKLIYWQVTTGISQEYYLLGSSPMTKRAGAVSDPYEMSNQYLNSLVAGAKKSLGTTLNALKNCGKLFGETTCQTIEFGK